MKISTESLSLVLSCLLVLILIYFHIPISVLHQIILLLLLLILLISRVIFSHSQFTREDWFNSTLLFLSSWFVQILVISTGGFFSPLLILLHLYILGTSFLFNLQLSVNLLVLSLIVLTANLWFDARIFVLFYKDPILVFLYILSFMVIIPLAILLNHTYKIKDTISKILSKHIELSRRRERSILGSLSELVLVTDKDLNILYVNEALQKLLHKNLREIIAHPLLGTVILKDKNGSPITIKSLLIDKVINNKSSQIMEDLLLYSNDHATVVIIKVLPIIGLTGEIIQIVFIIKDKNSLNF